MVSGWLAALFARRAPTRRREPFVLLVCKKEMCRSNYALGKLSASGRKTLAGKLMELQLDFAAIVHHKTHTAASVSS